MSSYFEISLYGFKTIDSDGSTTALETAAERANDYGVYVMERDSKTDEVIEDLDDEDFTSIENADKFAEEMQTKYGGEIHQYAIPNILECLA